MTDNKNAAAPQPLATKAFVLLCVVMFFGYANFSILTPVIPLYVEELGGSAFIAGLVLLAFSIPSFTIRPFVGRLADRWSAAGVLALGLLTLGMGTLIALVPLIAMLFAGNFVRGVGWAGLNTGGFTVLASAAPVARRGEASGYYTGVMTSVAIVFPALGLWLLDALGAATVFFASAVLALAALPIAWSLRERKSEGAAPAADGHSSPAGLIDRGVLIASALNLCASLVQPSLMAFLPLYARELGIANIGWFYVLAGVTSIVIRPLLGKKSDAIGRGPTIAIGLASQLIGFVLMIGAHTFEVILAGGFFVTVGTAMIGATTTALALDLSDPRSRGRGMATFSLSYQIGAGAGAVLSGALADLVGLRGMYVGSAVIAVAGFALLTSAWKSLPPPQDIRA